MKKIIVNLTLTLLFFAPAGKANPVGLYRSIPYLSNWGQSWLTNSSGVSAAQMMFGDPNAAAFIWQQFQPFAFFQNTNALTPAQINQLNFASSLSNAINFGPLVDSSGMGSQWTNPDGSTTSESTYNVLVTPAGPPGMFTGISAPVFVVLDRANGWTTEYSSVTANDAKLGVPDSFVPSIPFVTANNYISPNSFQQTFFGCLALTTPFGYSVPSYSTNYTGAHFVPQTDQNGNITNFYVAYTGTNIVTINTLTQLNPTNLWFIDKYGNQWTLGTNQARAFVGDGSRLTGLNPAQVGAVSLTDSTYLSIPTVTSTANNALSTANTVTAAAAANSTAIATLQAGLKYGTNTVAAANTTPFTLIAPAFALNTPYVNNTGRRATLYANIQYTNTTGFQLLNTTMGWTSSFTNMATGQRSDTFEIPMSPGDTVEIVTNSYTSMLLRSWVLEQ